MEVKTVTIEMEAYEALAARKRAGESLSQVIKRTLADERYTASNLLEHIDSVMLLSETLDAIERVVTDRPLDLIAEPDNSYDA